MSEGFDKTRILTDAEVAFVTGKIRDMLGESFPGITERLPGNPEDLVRFMSVAEVCKQARDERGLSVKDVADDLRLPQYRITAVEESQLPEIDPAAAREYVEFLGLEEWFREWRAANPDLAFQLGLAE